MICKLNIKPPVTICLQTCSEYSERAASIWIEKGTQNTDRNMALSYTVSCQLSIIMKGAATYKIFKIPKLILRCVLVLMLGCEKRWHPLKHRSDKVRTPTPFSPPPQGQDTNHILLSKKLQIQLVLNFGSQLLWRGELERRLIKLCFSLAESQNISIKFCKQDGIIKSWLYKICFFFLASWYFYCQVYLDILTAF